MKLVKTFYFNYITFFKGFLQRGVIDLKECCVVERWADLGDFRKRFR